MWTKICANTTPEDALLAAKLGADAVIVVDARIQREGEIFDPYSWTPYEPAYGEKVVAKAIKFESLPATGR